MAVAHITRESSYRPAAAAGPGVPGQLPAGQWPDGHDGRRVWDTHDLYAQAEAARERAQLLAGQLQATQRRASETWQLIRDSWDRVEQIQARRLAARTVPDRLRYSAYTRLQARLASLPVIEQAKGIIMAQYGWPEEKAFDALRRVSQRHNVKVRDLAASIVARTASLAPAGRQAGPPAATSPGRNGQGDIRHRRA